MRDKELREDGEKSKGRGNEAYLNNPYTLPVADAKWRVTVGLACYSGIHASVFTFLSINAVTFPFFLSARSPKLT